jgi:hypothetical protein
MSPKLRPSGAISQLLKGVGVWGIEVFGGFRVIGWRLDTSSSVELMEDLKENIYNNCFPVSVRV